MNVLQLKKDDADESGSRVSVIPAVAQIVNDFNALHKVNHDSPDVVILIEIVGTEVVKPKPQVVSAESQQKLDEPQQILQQQQQQEVVSAKSQQQFDKPQQQQQPQQQEVVSAKSQQQFDEPQQQQEEINTDQEIKQTEIEDKQQNDNTQNKKDDSQQNNEEIDNNQNNGLI
ncbi:hypothetical protein KUTeg_003382 [Tegillarca granosa]|uniref:Uncharacterized protein n=1 Tax=Tegillarca granosa TaxID=220873 RepID=A0ABQ9FLX8_TEGGR|nr:hypothetical protein KUTeg_003382 [Tegillarca granosa]